MLFSKPFALLVGLVVGTLSSWAWAETLIVKAGTSLDLDGDHLYSLVVVEAGATIKVKPKTDTATGVGYLHLQANSIVVEAGAAIIANGAGNRGYNGAAGGGLGGGQAGATGGDPGAGGAYIGKGGDGVSPTCQTRTAGPAAFTTKPSLGSGGGAAGTGGMGSRGGAGGGYIILEAAELRIGGKVEARGENGLVVNKLGSGGGSGGYIELVSNHLIFEPGATLSVHGGDGGVGTTGTGGSGGGGFVLVTAPEAGSIVADVAGGANACAPGAGADGAVDNAQTTVNCLDLDKDGHGAMECPDGSGDDCDESDPKTYTGAPEMCDGLDQDCSGSADDPASPSACADGLVCVDAMCVIAPESSSTGDGSGSTGSGSDSASSDDGGCATAPVRDRPLPIAFGIGLLGLVAARLGRRAR